MRFSRAATIGAACRPQTQKSGSAIWAAATFATPRRASTGWPQGRIEVRVVGSCSSWPALRQMPAAVLRSAGSALMIRDAREAGSSSGLRCANWSALPEVPLLSTIPGSGTGGLRGGAGQLGFEGLFWVHTIIEDQSRSNVKSERQKKFQYLKNRFEALSNMDLHLVCAGAVKVAKQLLTDELGVRRRDRLVLSVLFIHSQPMASA